MQDGNLHMLVNLNDDPLILAPANNMDHFSVAAYLEAFWGYCGPQLITTIAHRLESGERGGIARVNCGPTRGH